MKKTKIITVLAIVMSMSTLVTTVQAAPGHGRNTIMAVDQANKNFNKTNEEHGKDQGQIYKIKILLDNLVTAGTITSEQETYIVTVLTSNPDNLKTALNTLAEAGTITSAQVTAIETALGAESEDHGRGQQMSLNNAFMHQEEGKGQGHINKIKTFLDSFVTAGTITSDQETAIVTALTSNTGDFKTVLDTLVTAGTITLSQETAIETSSK